MNNLIDTLHYTNLSDLFRAFNSNKEYFYFDISVYNVGANIQIKCTNTFKNINPNTWNGYNFLIENDGYINCLIYEALKNILNDISINKTDKQIKRINSILKNHK